MALTIYGSPQSRTLRVLWMAAELGLAFEAVSLAFSDPALKQPGFLAINPAGRIPAIVDDGFALSESLAINLYLARKHGSDLYPATLEGEARVWAWTLWAVFDLEAPLESLRRHRAWLPECERVPAIADEAEGRIAAALPVLDGALRDHGFLMEPRFTIADLNVACVLSPSRTAFLNLEPFAAVRSWLDRCHARPAWQATRRRLDAG